jgi:hypothetical protein
MPHKDNEENKSGAPERIIPSAAATGLHPPTRSFASLLNDRLSERLESPHPVAQARHPSPAGTIQLPGKLRESARMKNALLSIASTRHRTVSFGLFLPVPHFLLRN